MDKKILLGVIEEKLEIIQEQFSIIRDYEGKIPTIEVDLLMSNIRDLYDLFINLQQGNRILPGDIPFKEEPVRKPEMPPPPVDNDVAGNESVYDAPEPADIPEITVSFKSPSILGFEPVVEESPHPLDPLPPIPPLLEERGPGGEVVNPEPETRNPEPETRNPEPETRNLESRPVRSAFDLFSEGSHGTLADKYRENQEKSVADKLSENKVIDLRTTIGINDKFLFINELFDGNMRIYDEAVKKLNDCATLAQSDLLLLDLKIVYNWDSEAPTVKKFVELVRRKF